MILRLKSLSCHSVAVLFLSPGQSPWFLLGHSAPASVPVGGHDPQSPAASPEFPSHSCSRRSTNSRGDGRPLVTRELARRVMAARHATHLLVSPPGAVASWSSGAARPRTCMPCRAVASESALCHRACAVTSRRPHGSGHGRAVVPGGGGRSAVAGRMSQPDADPG